MRPLVFVCVLAFVAGAAVRLTLAATRAVPIELEAESPLGSAGADLRPSPLRGTRRAATATAGSPVRSERSAAAEAPVQTEALRLADDLRAIHRAYEEAGWSDGFARNYGSVGVRPLGATPAGQLPEPPEGAELVEDSAVARARLSRTNRASGVPRLDGTFRYAGFRSRGRWLDAAGEAAQQSTIPATSEYASAGLRAVAQQRGVPLASLPQRAEEDVLAAIRALNLALRSQQEELWTVVQESMRSGDVERAAVPDVIAVYADADGQLWVLRRGDDADVDRLLSEMEAEQERLEADLRASAR